MTCVACVTFLLSSTGLNASFNRARLEQESQILALNGEGCGAWAHKQKGCYIKTDILAELKGEFRCTSLNLPFMTRVPDTMN